METLFSLTFIMLILTLAFPIPGSSVTTALQSVCVCDLERELLLPCGWHTMPEYTAAKWKVGWISATCPLFIYLSEAKKNPAFPHTAVLRKILSKLLGLQSQGLNFVLEEDGNITMPVCTYSDIH